MAENISEQRTAKLEALVKQRFTPEGRSERVAKALAALRREQPIKLSPQDWKWVAEDADLGDEF
jgi:hypothetical protein